MKDNSFTHKYPKLVVLNEKLKNPTKKLLLALSVRAIYSLFIAVSLSLLLGISLQFYVTKEAFNNFMNINFEWLLALTYLLSFAFMSISAVMDFYGKFIDITIEVFLAKTTKPIDYKPTVRLKLNQKRFLSNFLKWTSIGLLVTGTFSAILMFQESILGLSTYTNLGIFFGLAYGLGFIIIFYRNLLMTNVDWILVYLEDFRKTKNLNP